VRNGFIILITFEKTGTFFEYVFKVNPDDEFMIEDLGLRSKKYHEYGSPIIAVEMSSEAFDWYVMHPTGLPPERLPEFDFTLVIPNLFADDERTNAALFRFNAEEQVPELVGIIADTGKYLPVFGNLIRHDVPNLVMSPFMSIEEMEIYDSNN
jgi:hypothetical protein